MAERNDPKDPRDPQPTQPIPDPRNPQPTQLPHDPRAPGDPRLPNDPRPPYDPRNPQGQPERTQTEISREAKPGTPASRDAAAARSGKIAGQQAGVSTQTLEPPPEPLPIRAPASHAIPLVSTTAAPRPPEGPLLVTLYSVADPNNIIQCMPIDAQDHLASGEWTLTPAGDVPLARDVQKPEPKRDV
jgi:hypothetical protein